MKIQDREKPSSEEKAILAEAWRVREHAYAPYSRYKVGAAIRDERSEVHLGCNVENAMYTGTHAERSAISALIASGAKQIKSIAIATENGGSPCGDCRQHIWQFCKGNQDVPVVCEDAHGRVEMFTIGELLPNAVDLETSS